MRLKPTVAWSAAWSAYILMTTAQAAAKIEHFDTTAVTHRVSARQADLLDTLLATGWWRAESLCWDRSEPHVTGFGHGADVHMTRVDRISNAQQDLYIWRSPELWHGLPMWMVVATQQTDLAWASQDFYAAVTEDLLSGIARVHPSSGSVWVEIRHAPLRLEDVMLPLTDARCDDPNRCDPAMPVVLPLQGDLVDTVVWRDNYDDDSHRVALTFDACSTFETAFYNKAVTEVLVANNIPATLFVGGHWAETHRQELQQLGQNPLFEIANHSYSHPHMTQLSPRRQRQELLWTQYLIYNAIGTVPRYFRPPYGEIDDTLIGDAARMGLTTIEFDLPAGDADVAVSDARLTDWILRKASGGSIVVMHMNRLGSKTAEVLPEVARQLRARGYILTKVSDLLAAQRS